MLSVFAFFAVFMKIFDRQNMLIFFKIFNHRWRWLAWFHRFFGAQTNFFVNFIYKNPRKHLQNPWHSYHNFWHGCWTIRAICLLSRKGAQNFNLYHRGELFCRALWYGCRNLDFRVTSHNISFPEFRSQKYGNKN